MTECGCKVVLTAQVRQLEADKLRSSATFAPSSHAATPPPPLPAPDALLPDIVRLWHELHVPLLARSQFLVAHAGREPYFFSAEHEHLLELQRCARLVSNCNSSGLQCDVWPCAQFYFSAAGWLMGSRWRAGTSRRSRACCGGQR